MSFKPNKTVNQVYDMIDMTGATTLTIYATDEDGLYVYDYLVIYADFIDEDDIRDFVTINEDNYIYIEEGAYSE